MFKEWVLPAQQSWNRESHNSRSDTNLREETSFEKEAEIMYNDQE